MFDFKTKIQYIDKSYMYNKYISIAKYVVNNNSTMWIIPLFQEGIKTLINLWHLQWMRPHHLQQIGKGLKYCDRIHYVNCYNILITASKELQLGRIISWKWCWYSSKMVVRKLVLTCCTFTSLFPFTPNHVSSSFYFI